jgi:hypothetical protein
MLINQLVLLNVRFADMIIINMPENLIINGIWKESTYSMKALNVHIEPFMKLYKLINQ